MHKRMMSLIVLGVTTCGLGFAQEGADGATSTEEVAGGESSSDDGAPPSFFHKDGSGGCGCGKPK